MFRFRQLLQIFYLFVFHSFSLNCKWSKILQYLDAPKAVGFTKLVPCKLCKMFKSRHFCLCATFALFNCILCVECLSLAFVCLVECLFSFRSLLFWFFSRLLVGTVIVVVVFDVVVVVVIRYSDNNSSIMHICAFTFDFVLYERNKVTGLFFCLEILLKKKYTTWHDGVKVNAKICPVSWVRWITNRRLIFVLFLSLWLFNIHAMWLWPPFVDNA